MSRLTTWTIAALLAILMGAMAAEGPSDDEAARDAAAEAQAAEQDEAAMASRDWAGRQVCGPYAIPRWVGDKELTCKELPMAVAGGSL